MKIDKEMIYQLFVGRGQSANLVDHQGQVLDRLSRIDWQKLKQAGFSQVYLLGIWDARGPILVTDEAGIDLKQCPVRLPSIFAQRNQSEIDPRLGTKEEFVMLVAKIHQAGLKVLADFVPNHTGVDHEWVRNHPEYYWSETRDFSGDVLKLNYEKQAVRLAMLKVIEQLLSYPIDGFRIDMAHLVPLYFWEAAIKFIRQRRPEFYLLAEAYSHDPYDLSPLTNLLAVGFDSVYDELSYRNLKEQNFHGLKAHWEYLDHFLYRERWTRYLANHDDNAPMFIGGEFWSWLKLWCGLPGSILIPNGFLWGKLERLRHHCLDCLPDSMSELMQIPSNLAKMWPKDGGLAEVVGIEIENRQIVAVRINLNDRLETLSWEKFKEF